MLTILALFTACAPDSSDVAIGDPVGCGEGFGRADDGNCYPIGDGDTGGAWTFTDYTCQGTGAYEALIDIGYPADPTTPISVVGLINPEMAASCIQHEGEPYWVCDEFSENAAWGTPPGNIGIDADGMVVAPCWWTGVDWSASGGETLEGFGMNPIRVFYPAP